MNMSSIGFNEAAGADPADAAVRNHAPAPPRPASMRPRGQTPRMHQIRMKSASVGGCFNEAAGADPADADHQRRRRHQLTPLQ